MDKLYKKCIVFFFIFISIIQLNNIYAKTKLKLYKKKPLNSRGQLFQATESLEGDFVKKNKKPNNQDDLLPIHIETSQDYKTKDRLDLPAFKPEENSFEEENSFNDDNSLFEKQEADSKVEETSKVSEDHEDEEEISFNFENADLSNVVSYVSSLFNVTFLTDDILDPIGPGAKAVSGNKISFKTQKPLSKKRAWDLFVSFLDMAGLSLVKQEDSPIAQGETMIYRIMPIAAAKKSQMPTFIGVDHDLLLTNDRIVRYVYFVKDAPLDTIKSILDSFKSKRAEILLLQEIKAFVITDSSYNIKSLMKIISEIDKVSQPPSMAVFKLKRVDAAHVKKLYESLITPAGAQASRARSSLFGPKKGSKASYFPEHARIIVEPRTNSLILLGTQEDIKKIEKFVMQHVDIDTGTPYSPLHIYQLNYADAETIAGIMNNVVKFGQSTVAAKSGGVRGNDKYIKSMTFTPEKSGNRIIIRGEYDDYLKAKEIIARLDAPQPQVAVEILILSVSINDTRELGSQIRKKIPGTDGFISDKINYQTSGLRLGGSPAITELNTTITQGAQRLLGDLMNLVTGTTAGNTVLALGNDSLGVWGIFNALKTVSNLQVVSNPFLVATNKTKAKVLLGEIRNVKSATIQGTSPTDTFSEQKANLTVEVTPHINSDGMIQLKLDVSIVEFSDKQDAASATRTEKVINTNTIVADREVLALGGLIKNKIEDALSTTPLLGKIPLFGWLFKNKRKAQRKEDLLILLSARIIEPETKAGANAFTNHHIAEYKNTMGQMDNVNVKRDPVDRWMFMDDRKKTEKIADDFIFGTQNALKEKKIKVVKADKPVVKKVKTVKTKKNKKRRKKRKGLLTGFFNSEANKENAKQKRFVY